jgi:hypothetical protein
MDLRERVVAAVESGGSVSYNQNLHTDQGNEDTGRASSRPVSSHRVEKRNRLIWESLIDSA